MLGGICSNCQQLLVVLVCLVDEGEGFVGNALGGVEFHQVLLALQDGVVTAADNLPEIHVAVVVVVVERVVGTEEEIDGNGGHHLRGVVAIHEVYPRAGSLSLQVRAEEEGGPHTVPVPVLPETIMPPLPINADRGGVCRCIYKRP